MIQIPLRKDIKNKRSFDKIYLKFCAKCNFTISESGEWKKGIECGENKREWWFLGYLMQREIGQSNVEESIKNVNSIAGTIVLSKADNDDVNVQNMKVLNEKRHKDRLVIYLHFLTFNQRALWEFLVKMCANVSRFEVN